jgi:hypothetical protein
MVMIKEHEGTEEWWCSSCGRHLLVSWSPAFKKTVLVEGDSLANHTRIKINSQPGEKIEKPAAMLPKPVMDLPDDDPRLIPWLIWMEASGFENLWDDDDI